MPENSTLLYWVDDFDVTSEPIRSPFILKDTLSTDFLNAVFGSLEYDPGDELVKKILM